MNRRDFLRATGGGAAALLAGSLMSCTAPGAPKGKVLIEFWDYPRLPAVSAWLRTQLDEFMRLHPEVHINFTRLSWAKGGERLDIAAFAGRPPDIAGSTLTLKYVEADLLAPVDELLDEPTGDGITFREDIHPQMLRSMQWDGRTWAFPWYKEGFVVLLNQDILEERGVPIPPGGKWTWDEFLATMQRLTFKRPDGTQVYGIGFNTGKEKWEAYPFLIGEGMEILSEDGRRSLIDSEATRRGIQRLLTLEYDAQVALPGAGGMLDAATWVAFSGRERRLAATCQALWSINAVKTINESLGAERAKGNPAASPLRVVAVNFPQMPGNPQRAASYGTGCYMVFKRKLEPERTQWAARLARFLTLEQGQQINRQAGLLPSRRSAFDVLKGDARFEYILDQLPEAVSPPVHPAWPQLDQVIGEQLQLALLRRVSVDAAVTAMGARTQMVLDDFWRSRDAGRKGSA